VIPDTHGHLPAAEAVLTNARARGADVTVCLGEVATPGLKQAETLDLLTDSNCCLVPARLAQVPLGRYSANDSRQ
jgi:hypothetical protein